MAVLNLKRLFGTGGSDLNPQGPGNPSLLRKLLAMCASVVGATPAWVTGVAVTTHVAVMAGAGLILSVEGTTGSSVGPKQIIQSGSPAAGQVDVQYDAAGIATLTFNATDAITVAAVTKLGYGGDTVSIEA
jgi:hypothetical protein